MDELVNRDREERLFEGALAKPAAERGGWLDSECGTDAALRSRLELRLARHEQVEGAPTQVAPAGSGEAITLDDTSASTALGRSGVTGTVIAGRYTLLQKLGEGGMGEVWIAQQSEPVNRRVALKLIRTGLDSKAVLQRFEQERQALALMDHPNIARVHDGGMTPSGQPFFVMELVDGKPLNEFADEVKLTPRQRLELFVPVCQAVQHAHQKAIVHRDLKPANILVTVIDGKPVAKVIDFGVAKATGDKLTKETMATMFGAVIGTLEYMAPEQAAGTDVDTRADIYSLGVILYELLTGVRPFSPKRLEEAALAEVLRIVQEEEPPKPSTRLSTEGSLGAAAAARQIEPRKLVSMLRGELDCVVMRCLEKQRSRRYDTANGLARDIQRYLADEPVEARPPSRGYRLEKFVRRHKGLVTASALVMVSLFIAIVGTTMGMVEARTQERAAVAARRAETEEKKAAEAARSAAQEQARIAQQNAALASQQAMTLLTGIQTIFTNARTNDPPLPAAVMESLLNTALLSVDKVAASYDSSKTTKEATTAAILDSLGSLYQDMGRSADAQKYFLASYEVLKERVKIKQGSDPSRNNLASACKRLGRLALSYERDPAKSLSWYEQALSLRRDTFEHPKHEEFEFPRWRSAIYLADGEQDVAVAHLRLGHLAEAREHFESGLRAARVAVDSDPTNALQESTLQFSLLGVAEIQCRFGEFEKARTLHAEALALQEALVARHSQSIWAKQSLASILYNIASVSPGEPREDEELLERAESIARENVALAPDRADTKAFLAIVLLHRGLALQKAGQTNSAAKLAECVAIRRRLAAISGPRDTVAAIRLAVALGAQGEILEASDLARKLQEDAKGDSEALIELARCFAYAAAHASGQQQLDLSAESERALLQAAALHYVNPMVLRVWLKDSPVLQRPGVVTLLAEMDAEVARQRKR